MKTGVILPMGENEETGRVRSYGEIRSLALAAEANGLDAIWIYDHLLFHFEEKEPQGVWEAWTIMSALAEVTERVEIGSLVLCTAFRNPAVLAKMAVALDEVSSGRLTLGIGAGWHKPEFDAFGLQFTHLVDQFEEAVEIIAPLIREGSVDFEGTYSSAPNCLMVPPPTRPVPLLIAGFKPRMARLVAKYADAWNTCWHGYPEATEDHLRGLKAACEAEGRDIASIDITVGVNIAFTDLAPAPEGSDNRMKYITGSVQDVAAGLSEYRERGTSQVIAALHPLTTEGVEALAAAGALSR